MVARERTSHIGTMASYSGAWGTAAGLRATVYYAWCGLVWRITSLLELDVQAAAARLEYGALSMRPC